MNRWQSWLDEATESSSARAIGKRLDRSHSTVLRWMHGTAAPCEDIIAIAREFCADPIEGMVAAGWLDEGDFTKIGLRNAIGRAPAVMLADELHSRLASGRIGNEMGEIKRLFR